MQATVTVPRELLARLASALRRVEKENAECSQEYHYRHSDQTRVILSGLCAELDLALTDQPEWNPGR